MVDLRGKPPYLPPDMTYTDVLKHAIDKGLQFFGYDAETDDPSDVKAKQLAFKEELFNAQKHFNTSKEKYYADLKLSQQKDIAPEYKEAYEYYNNQKQVKEEADKLQKDFLNKTDKVFSDDFKIGNTKAKSGNFSDTPGRV